MPCSTQMPSSTQLPCSIRVVLHADAMLQVDAVVHADAVLHVDHYDGRLTFSSHDFFLNGEQMTRYFLVVESACSSRAATVV